MRISFHGGAKSVTGANYLLDTGSKKFLIDCGLFQGSKYAEHLNYEKFSYDPSEINAVFITHSHTDHSGRLPKLWKEGFRGTIYTTKPTEGLLRAALPDNLGLITEEAKEDKHQPLFDKDDLNSVLGLIKSQDYYKRIDLGNRTYAIFHNAGHILGSAIVEIGFRDKRIYFSGDLGNPPTPLLPDPDFVSDADYLVIESAYGSRVHEDRDKRKDILEDTIEETVTRGGALMVPSFAIERTQELLFELNELVMYKRIPPVTIYVDSPLAQTMTVVYEEYKDYFNEEARKMIKRGGKIFQFPGLMFTKTTEESKAINDALMPKVIIAGSGMSNGGRILHHERRYLSDPNSAILFTGYQVKGSLGRRILDGEPEVKIFGEKIPVRCHIKAIGGYSSHADQDQLLKWVSKTNENRTVKRVFVVQGEEESATALALKIRDHLSIDSTVPDPGEEFDIDI